MLIARFCSAVALLGWFIASQPATADVMQYTYQVQEKKPFSRDIFTQGLEIENGKLWLSSGLHGRSFIRVYDFATMQLEQEFKLPGQYFAEGVTKIGNRAFQLTWRSGDMLIYQTEPLKPIARVKIPGEGWGITHHGDTLYYSDGSANLYAWDATGKSPGITIPVTLNGKPVVRLNELEWIDGKIWANVWQTNQIVQISPETGEVTGVIDFSGLLAQEDRLRDTDVLNGIAYDRENDAIWVTGKRWPWLYRVTLEEIR